MTKILILEQSKSMRNSLRERLDFENYSTEAVDSTEAAAELCNRIAFDVLIAGSGMKLPDRSIPTIIIDSRPTITSAVEAFKHGAIDYMTLPLDMNLLLTTLRSLPQEDSAERPEPAAAPSRHRHRRVERTEDTIIGRSEAIEHVRSMIERVAPSDARVLIMGENGTGKELVARMMHNRSERCNGPFVEVNCAAIPAELIESELFGHEKGSFTSAVRQRKGKFELADGGTLFMDEIGDMSLSAQAKVLRALQENKISRVGSDKDVEVNVRVVAATNKNLREEIRRGNFREDLYHRLGVIVIEVPALRERASDIPELVGHFLRRVSEELHTPLKEIDRSALDALRQKDWTGNIRELRNVVERLLILSGERITLEDVERYC